MRLKEVELLVGDGVDAGAVGVYEAMRRVHRGRRITPARSKRRTGAPARSTTVPLPVSAGGQASQWARRRSRRRWTWVAAVASNPSLMLLR